MAPERAGDRGLTAPITAGTCARGTESKDDTGPVAAAAVAVPPGVDDAAATNATAGEATPDTPTLLASMAPPR